MRYFTTSISHSQFTVRFSWGDFVFARKRADVSFHMLDFGRLISGYILRDAVSCRTGKPGSWNEEEATNVAFFISYNSKYAEHHDWTQVRAWFKRQEPAIQAQLVRARIWFSSAAREQIYRPWSVTPFGSLIMADLSTGAIVMATHVDHSDC